MAGQIGFWDVEDRLSQLSRHGDPLEKFCVTVDFEIFRADLAKAVPRRDRSKGGRPPVDPVLKFRMLVLQALNGLSLEQTEFLVKDRLSWMRFCGLGPGDGVPDANTLWDFREALDCRRCARRSVCPSRPGDHRSGYLPMSGEIWTPHLLPRHVTATPRTRRPGSRPARRQRRSGRTSRSRRGRRIPMPVGP